MRFIQPRLGIVPVIITALLLAACTAGGGGSATSTPPISPTAAASSTPAVQPTAASSPPAGDGATATAPPQPSPTGGEAAPTQPAAETAPSPAQNAASLPDASQLAWTEVVSGLARPLDLAHSGDGSGRLFVLEQVGVIRIIQNDQLLPEPFLDIRDRVGATSNEQGLLGIAFHPQYPQNGYFYLNYTDRRGDTVIARYSVSADSPDRADPNSEFVLLQVDQPYPNHNGGQVAFGPDGYLYIALGDGGSANDPQGRGQSLNTLLGKILRIDVDNGDRYAIPADNPFVGGGGLPEIWMYGLRNPWRFSFDTATGDMYIADVGQNAWEEINFWPAGAPGGANFGWAYREGAHPFRDTPPAGVELIDPVAEYQHPTGCSVTGGYVYRGAALPEMQGVYLYSDYCSGIVWGLLRQPDGGWQNGVLFELRATVTSFGLDEAGEIYLINQAGGSVLRLTK